MTKSPNDLKTHQHNTRQIALFEQIKHNEEWYLSQELGYDCKTTAYGRKLLEERVANVLLNGAGAWMNDETENPKSAPNV